MLKDFVCHWLRLLTYIDNVSRRMLKIWDDADTFEQENYFPQTLPQPMSIDATTLTLTLTPQKRRYYDIRQPSMDEQ